MFLKGPYARKDVFEPCFPAVVRGVSAKHGFVVTSDKNECVKAVEEVDNNETVQGEINALYKTPFISAENYDPECHADNDDLEEEADGHRVDASLKMAIERLGITVHRQVEYVANNLRRILQKSGERLHRLLELRDAILQHEQEQLQKIKRAKAIILSVFENYTQE